MCGIAGLVHRPDEFETLVGQILESQHLRGPDHRASQAWTLGERVVELGYNRLKIIDLSNAGNQPRIDRSGRFAMVFNGEIYNYLEMKVGLTQTEFQSQSDTEVLLEAFAEMGPAAFAQTNGMFAFAILDLQERKLYMVRDRFGVKPLYYFSRPNLLAFASTSPVLASTFGLKPNLEYVQRGLALGVFEDGRASSHYEGLAQVRPGHFLEIDLDSLQVQEKCYYDLRGNVAAMKGSVSPEDALLRLDELMQDSLRLRFRSDVPVGISLSGGIDSGSIAALSGSLFSGTEAFSFSNPDDLRSEGPAVKSIAKRAGICVNYVSENPKSSVELFEKTLAAQDAPFSSASILAQFAVFREARKHDIPVMLGGQGGDEAFMGYRKYQLFRLQQLRRRGIFSAIGFGFQMVPMLMAERRSARLYWSMRGRYGASVASDSPVALGHHAAGSLSMPAGQEPWERQADDILRTSLPTLLRYEDRNSAGNSIESRLPFLDYRVVEFGLSLPDELKVRAGYGKWLVRQWASKLLPAEIVRDRAKRGFDVSTRAWILGGLGDHLRDQLSSAKDWLATSTNIESAFSNERLISRRATFGEATALIWLSRRS